jgi:hypothetical protein
MKIEGIYTYLCSSCQTLFGVVARFSVSGDKQEQLSCPKCLKTAFLCGEGNIQYKMFRQQQEIKPVKSTNKHNEPGYPIVLTAEHIRDVMKVSKRVAYEIMERKDFPLVRIGRLKRVNRDAFFDWLNGSR